MTAKKFIVIIITKIGFWAADLGSWLCGKSLLLDEKWDTQYWEEENDS